MIKLNGIVALNTKNGKIMGIDGYPYDACDYKNVNSIHGIHFFKDQDQAIEYTRIFPDYKPHSIEIKMELSPIVVEKTVKLNEDEIDVLKKFIDEARPNRNSFLAQIKEKLSNV